MEVTSAWYWMAAVPEMTHMPSRGSIRPSEMVAVHPVFLVVVQLGVPWAVTQSLEHVHRSVTDPMIVLDSRSAITMPVTVCGS